MPRDSQHFKELLGITEDYPWKISSERKFLEEHQYRVKKIATMQNCNQGGEYWRSAFFIDGVLYQLISSKNFFDDLDFKKTEVSYLTWIFT